MADRSGIKVTASDALEFEAVAPKVRKGGGVIKTLLFAIIAIFVGAGGWAYYGEQMMAMFGNAEDDIPIIRADISPIKVRPENPGGLQVPDRDKLVYDRILNGGNGEGRATVERLLPPPETPLPVPQSKPAAVPPSAAPIADTPEVSDVTAAVKPAPAPTAAAVPEAKQAKPSSLSSSTNGAPTRLARNPMPETPAPAPPPAPTVAPQSAIPAVPVPKPVQAAAEPPASGAPSAANPSENVYRVQLAAARTAEAARKEWDRLRRANLDVLGDLGLSVTKIDLGGTKGIFYRLRAGPLAGDQQARALCKELATRKIGCLVVRPGK
ncbi:MAG: SPOR domain-containing protein [Rhodospirillales bacterium]|nr:SPOR domain-containing protein [Rhodospirillales bacterium]